MRLQPLLKLMTRDNPCGDPFEKGDGLVLFFGRIDSPPVVVTLYEFEETEEASALVPIRHRVIANQVPCEHSSLLYELGVCLDAVIASGWSGKSRLSRATRRSNRMSVSAGMPRTRSAIAR
jgi:hypothetical protein